GFVTYEPLVAGYDKGLRGKFVYQLLNALDYKIALLPDSPIKGPKDLAGKSIGIASMGSNAIPVAKSILASAGVDENDVTFIPIGVGAAALEAMRNGQVDAYAAFTTGFGAILRVGQDLRYITHP